MFYFKNLLKKYSFVLTLSCLLVSILPAQGQNLSQNSQVQLFTASQQKLRITAENVRLIEDKEKGGYHLYVKKNANVNSILLTETTKDPTGKNDSYAYRAKEYNPINGDEIRYLDGKTLVSEGAKYSLVDSTSENTDFFGPAFHIYIPETIVYGYSWSRNGEVKLGKGTFINIRSFEKPYADYSGDYMDSPFMFDLKLTKKKAKKPVKKVVKEAPKVVEKPASQPFVEPEVFDEAPVEEFDPLPPVEEEAEEVLEEPETILTDDYNPVASDSFKEFSDGIIYSKGPETIIEDINSILDDIENKEDLDLVFAIDATGSMKNDLQKLKTDLMPALVKVFGENPKARIGLLFYRDYGDTFKYMELPVKCYGFTNNLTTFSKNLNSIRIYGKEGGDVPEAVYEALYAASEFYNWRTTAQKQVILIGDAEPHPLPRGSGKYSKEYVLGLAESKNVKIRSILLPKD
ncbi:MAG: VWA domain-containing protein [Treponema sp.]|nr:VWA domain-containing protein [Treponema sp.]